MSLGPADELAVPERPTDLDHALRPHSEQAPKGDQLGSNLAVELIQFSDATCLDELLQPCRDPGSDAAQLLSAAGCDQLCNGRLGLADGLGGAPVGAGRVEARTREIEQARECLELFRDESVVGVALHYRVSLAE